MCSSDLASLFDDPIEEVSYSKDNFTIDKKIKIPFEAIEFRYGSIVFKYNIPEMNIELEFDIENSEIRPEFEVLKSYFSKTLSMKNVTINIYAEFENGRLISQLATSEDVEKINREIIEGVKFKFINKNFLSKTMVDELGNLLDIAQLQINGEKKNNLYDSGEDLLDDVLKNINYKHYKNIKYLAEYHARNILKLRFVLQPFSFLFLLKGKEGFHIVLETLDTGEATYIWHYDNQKQTLPEKLKQINQYLNIIRNKGRQLFLENPPENFSRIVHDYSDERKGFIIWKDALEERLI